MDRRTLLLSGLMCAGLAACDVPPALMIPADMAVADLAEAEQPDLSTTGNPSNGWTYLAPMPTPRVDFASAVLGGKIYTVGGYTGSMARTVEVYDPATDQWTRKADEPTARRLAFAAAALGHLWIIGGVNGVGNVTYPRAVEEYDPTNDQWTTHSNLPMGGDPPDGGAMFSGIENNFYLAGASLNDKIYVFVFDPGIPSTTTATYEYDPSNDTWITSRAPGPLSYDEMVASTLGTKIYVAQRSGVANGMGPRSIAAYDPAQDLWTNILPPADMPVKRALTGAAVLQGKLFVVGGFTWDVFTPDGALGVVQYQDLQQAKWSAGPSLGTPRHSPAVMGIGSDLYVIGGGLTYPPNTVPTGIVEKLSLW